MSFITPDDFKNKIDQSRITAISGGDDTLLPQAIEAAILEAKGYLSRFDVDDLFGKIGNDRDPLLMQWLKDIAVWQFIGLKNPGIEYQDSYDRRNNAISSLKQIQSGSFVPYGWKTLAATATGENPGASFHIDSQPKRNTYR